jgi:hypothetical protein
MPLELGVWHPLRHIPFSNVSWQNIMEAEAPCGDANCLGGFIHHGQSMAGISMGAIAEGFAVYAQPLFDQTDGSLEQLNKAIHATFAFQFATSQKLSRKPWLSTYLWISTISYLPGAMALATALPS